MQISNALLSKIAYGDSGVARACTMNGATQAALKGQVKNLNEIVASLDQSIREAQVAENDERFWGRAVAVAELVVASCDLFMEIVSTGTPVGKGIKAIYEQKQTIAETSVGKFDPAKASTRAMKGATEFMPAGGKVVTRTLVSGADTVIDGVRDQITIKKVVLGAIDKNLAILKYAFDQEGKAKAAKVVKNGKAVLKAAVKVFDAFATEDGNGAGARTLIEQSNALKQRLKELNQQLIGCEELMVP